MNLGEDPFKRVYQREESENEGVIMMTGQDQEESKVSEVQWEGGRSKGLQVPVELKNYGVGHSRGSEFKRWE